MNQLQHPPKVDLCFQVRGREIPLDHGYALYGAISRILEQPEDTWLHGTDTVGIHLLRGRYTGYGRLVLGRKAELAIRLPVGFIARALPLAGKRLDIDGEPIRVGVSRTRGLAPSAVLYAHIVTTRNGQDEARFDEEIGRKLAGLQVQGSFQRGPRRVFRVKDRKVVGHSLLVSGLTAEESIRLQEQGLGGRRKMGCGVFVPWQR